MEESYKSPCSLAFFRSHSCRWFLAYLFCMIVSLSANAQETLIKGSVVDESDEPLIGATVMVVGIANGTSADLDGNFSIKCKPVSS